ncbi:MAG: hypothetical protein AABY15_07065 [Nanoarchaeota archaeon]
MKTSKVYIIEGVLQHASKSNMGRTYPYEIFKKSIEDYIQTLPKEKRMLIEINKLIGKIMQKHCQ